MSLFNTPVLESKRLKLCPFSDRHLNEQYVQWLNDPETVRYSENRHTSHTIESCTRYRDRFLQGPDYFWAIEFKDSNAHIGNINAIVDLPNKVADIGIIIGARETWGQGIGLEAWTTVMSFLEEQTDVEKISAGTMATNLGMQRIFAKSGMKEESRRFGQFLFEGHRTDLIQVSYFTKNGALK
ncbi:MULTISPECIES: GNAT family N-acetyltransferase [Kiloniella]|uniref:GNAT family N-acetyltransferase n=1 Tax=Kiloniellaceae TaxID=597359 RepID=UPI0031D67C1A